MLTETTLASPQRLQELLNETEEELKQIQPRIEDLEKQVLELRELKQIKQRLLTLKMSLTTLLDNINKDEVKPEELNYLSENEVLKETELFNFSELSASKKFRPDEAFKQAEKILKQKNSLNYEMFKAIVFKGGHASTEDIKAFLVESGATQPQTGEDFANVPLTEISSRINYLVRKGIVRPAERGSFYATVGWVEPE
jgi:hypothetical protein